MPLDPTLARGIVPLGAGLADVAQMLSNQRVMNERTDVMRQDAQNTQARLQQLQQATAAEQQQKQQEMQLREKYAELVQLDGAPPEVQAAYIAQQRQLHPEFAGTPFANMPPEQAIPIMRRGVEARLGIELPKMPSSAQEYALSKGDPGYAAFLKDQKPGGVSLSVNTGKNFYETLADKTATQFTDLYGQAMSAPERIRRADSVIQLLQKEPYTGAAADWKLAFAKAAKAAHYDFGGDSIADTETLARELAGSTLEAIKSSGLGGGTGFSNADRDFLEKVTGGQITLDAQSLRRVAMMNKRAAQLTMKNYNDRASRLDQQQLSIMGLARTLDIPSQGAPDASGLIPGNLYQDADGNLGRYLGNGKWKGQ